MNVSINDQFNAFAEGRYMDSDGQDSWCFNFYDWFCREGALRKKSDKLFPAMIRFCRKMNLDTSQYYCFFKNNCPSFDHLYDDFRICDRETGDVVFTVVPRRTHRDGSTSAEVWGKYNNFAGPIAQGRNMTEIYESNELRDCKMSGLAEDSIHTKITV